MRISFNFDEDVVKFLKKSPHGKRSFFLEKIIKWIMNDCDNLEDAVELIK